MSNTLKTTPGTKPESEWLVVRKRETDPWEVYRFTEYDEAVQFFDRAQTQWSDTFLCTVIFGPGRPLSSHEARVEMIASTLLREVHRHLEAAGYPAGFEGPTLLERLDKALKTT